MSRMSIVVVCSACAVAAWSWVAAAESTHQLETVQGVPAGLGAKIAPLLNPQGFRVKGPDGVICELWFAKEVAAKEGFEPTTFVKYPLTPGQLMGAVRFPTAGAALDFRGQEIPVGTYTLRYGQQPQDGNHLGTSDVLDFILACAADADTDPQTVANIKDLFALSAKAAGTTHPAIFLLEPPPAKPFEKPALVHQEDKNLWVLHVNVTGKGEKQTHPLPLQIVVAGQSGG